MTQPVAVVADGNVKIFYTPTVADPLNPTVAECTSASGFDLTCYLTADGWNPSTDTQVVTDDRLCSRQTFERPGRYTDKAQIKYVYRQQDPGDPDNQAFDTLKRLATGFLIVLWGRPFEDDIAAGEIVDVIPFTADVQVKQPSAANETLKIMQDLRITSTVQRDVEVVS